MINITFTGHKVVVHCIFVDFASIVKLRGSFTKQLLHLAEGIPPNSLILCLQLWDSLKNENRIIHLNDKEGEKKKKECLTVFVYNARDAIQSACLPRPKEILNYNINSLKRLRVAMEHSKTISASTNNTCTNFIHLLQYPSSVLC